MSDEALVSAVAGALVTKWNAQTYAGQTAIEDAATAIAAIRAAVEDDSSLSIVPSAWQRHVVEIEEFDFFLEHSVDCRIAGLRNCPIHAALNALVGAPQAPGRYYVELIGDALMFEGVA